VNRPPSDLPSGPDRLAATAPVPRWTRRRFAPLTGAALNLEPSSIGAAEADPGFNVDRRRTVLPPEPPGAPLPDGVFARAREHLRRYDVADPRLVRAVYDPRSPLEGRDLLLVGRFFGLRFPMGVRIVEVVDEPGRVAGRAVHRFRFGYVTLEGHLEQGRMDYEVVKFVDTGAVEFRIEAYSRRGPIANPVVRLGFALFGRRSQLRFYARCLRRMRRFVADETRPVDPDGTGG
jgi:uncharacterized protein (UPF0548 family)